jgi:hypothetical protein
MDLTFVMRGKTRYCRVALWARIRIAWRTIYNAAPDLEANKRRKCELMAWPGSHRPSLVP